MAASLDLRYILLEILPSPVLEAKARELRIQNHLEMIRGRLWALNAVIVDALVRALEEPEVEEWVRDVEMVNADVEDLLRGIMGWQPRAAAACNRLPCSFLGVGVAHSRRQTFLLELVEKARRLNYLLRRQSSLGLRKDMMDSVDPRGEQEEYSTMLREEVVGRDTDVDEIIKILQRQQKDCRDHALFLVAIFGGLMVGKTTVARMVFHHPWVRGHFHRRIWIDVPSLSSFDPVWIAKEFARSIAGEPCEDVWLFCGRFGGGFGRYLLVLDDIHIDEEDESKWYQLEHFLFLLGERGSTVIFTGEFYYSQYIYNFSIDEYTYNWERYHLSRLPNKDWTKLFVKHATSGHPDDDQVEANLLITLTGLIWTGIPADAKMLGSLFRYTKTSWLPEEQLRRVGMDDHRINWMFLQYIPPRLARFNLYRWLMPPDHISDHGDLLSMLAAEGLSEGLQEYLLESQTHNDFYERIGNVIERCRFTMRVGQDSTFPRQCLHVHLLVESQTSAFPAALSKKENRLRTLVLRREEEMILKQRPCGITSIPEAMFANLTHLRILYLGATSIRQLPRTIGMLQNLRLLNLSGAHVQALPASLCNLRQLQILNVAW
ncbi:resistance protein [Musa troglodytarum]|uniref:Resistance protein n=1 Tax=Musa troglodytarum TaxID=320322 RepID=A0A9E7I7Y9_9LILI|nr:resistance protein [Musa troglodytarum]